MRSILHLFLLLSFSSWGQTYEQPAFESSNAPTLFIDRIVVSPTQTVFHFTFVNDVSSNLLLGFPDETYIKVSGTDNQLDMVRVEGMSVYPEEELFEKMGDKISFRVFFPPIPSGAESLDIRGCGGLMCLEFGKISLREK